VLARFLQPSRLGTLLLLGILVVQFGVLHRQRELVACGDYGSRSTKWRRVGLPTIAEIETRRATNKPTTRAMRVNWPVAALMLAGAYGVAMPVGAWLSNRRSSAAVGHGFQVIQGPASDRIRTRQPASAAR
jgi:hypothetical protein